MNRTLESKTEAGQFPAFELTSSPEIDTRDMAQCCRELGAFHIRDGGVLSSLATGAIDEARAFFSQSEAEKSTLMASRERQYLGYRAHGAEASMASGQGEPCEQYKLGYFRQESGVSEDTAPSYLSQQPFAGATLDYWRAVRDLATTIADRLAETLGFGCDYFRARSSQPLHQLGLNHYPPAGIDTKLSMSEHRDLCLFALIAQDGPGLQVENETGQFQTVESRPGTVFLILGEYMHRWSGGRFKAPLHRVIASRDAGRLSVIYKHRTDYDSVIDVPLLCPETGRMLQQNFHTGAAYAEKIDHIMGATRAVK